MRPNPAKIPVSVLAQALVLAAIVGIPFLFVAVNQARRACGNSLFGSREHFCSASELWSWWLSLPQWSQALALFATAGALALIRWSLRRAAS